LLKPNAAEPQPKRASARTTNATRFAVIDVILSAVHPALRARLSRPLVYVGGCYGCTVGLQVAHIAPRSSEAILLAVDVIEHFRTGAVAVHGEVAGNVVVTHSVDQLAAQGGMVAERFLQSFADLLLAKEAEFQGVVLTADADVVDEEVILGDFVPLLGVIPVPTGVGDQQAVPVDQGVVDGDYAVVTVASSFPKNKP